MANTKTLNSIFGRPAVVSARPDSTWPLPSDFVGIEIEVEEYDGNSMNLYPAWTTHSDGSLRNGIEFVTSAPVGGEDLTAAIDQFFNNGHDYQTGPRTSIHIHINASDNMNVDQFRNMLVLMYVIEPAVFRWADENRKWCGYCSPLTDIPPQRFVTMLNENDNDAALVRAIRGESNHDRYFGFNVAAYGKHGTVEFRYFPCTTERDLLIKWVKFVMYVKKAAITYDSIPAMLHAMDGDTQLQLFMQNHFPDVYDDLWTHVDSLDVQVRVRDILSSLHVKAVNDRTPVLFTMQNPAIHRLINTTFPDHKHLLETKQKTNADTASSARELFDVYINNGMNRFDAYRHVADRYGAGQAMHILQQAESRARREERTQQNQAQTHQVRWSTTDLWSDMQFTVPLPPTATREVQEPTTATPTPRRRATRRTIRNPFEASGDE